MLRVEKSRHIDEIADCLSKLSLPDLTRGPCYLTSNELGETEALTKLSCLPRAADFIHLGFGSLSNLSIVAARRSEGAIIGDISRNMLRMYGEANDAFFSDKVANRFDFVSKLESALVGKGNSEFLWPSSQIALENLSLQLTQERSWLGSDQSFEFIRTLVQRGKINFVALSVTDQLSITKIEEAIVRAGNKVDTLYISSIYDELQRYPGETVNSKPRNPRLQLFCKNLQVLCHEKTILIDTDPDWERGAQRPTQRVRLLNLQLNEDERYALAQKAA